jgi:uncharacterized membrane-anchored protein
MIDRRVLIAIFAVIALGVINWSVFQREQVLQSGEVILLELAPVDPRSLIQGDFMRLRYVIANEVGDQRHNRDGKIVVRLDENQIARLVEIYDGKRELMTDERLVTFSQRGFQVQIGPPSFFFQEGHAQYYEDAEYGELRLGPNGQLILVGLRGPDLDMLGPPD